MTSGRWVHTSSSTSSIIFRVFSCCSAGSAAIASKMSPVSILARRLQQCSGLVTHCSCTYSRDWPAWNSVDVKWLSPGLQLSPHFLKVNDWYRQGTVHVCISTVHRIPSVSWSCHAQQDWQVLQQKHAQEQVRPNMTPLTILLAAIIPFRAPAD